jgi:diguanylate cyclase (GGDEF)-like protein
VLTGLPNRVMLIERLTELLARSGRLRVDAATLFVDLDMFKVINDSLGHAAGDEVLEQVACRFRAAVRPEDFVARFGGDEFVVLSEQVGGVDGAVRIAERLASTLQAPFSAAGASVVVTASIGIAHADDALMDAETLIRNADVAMYRAKELGRDGYVLFEDLLYQRVAHRLSLEQELRQALTDDLIEVWFQPQVRLSDGVIVGVEALARWPRTPDDSISPERFIPVAEETGLIVTLGRDVLARACRQAAEWRREPALRNLGVTVNVSARQLTDAGLCDTVIDLLAEHGLDPSALCLEVTESALVRDLDRAVLALDKLHGIGVRLAIDDFGTGYATLEHVRSFSMADELKIDQSFVADLERDLPQDRAIVSASVVLAHALGMSTVAEGVETRRQLAVLTDLGCDLAQGYLFSPALPAEELGPLLRAGRVPLFL